MKIVMKYSIFSVFCLITTNLFSQDFSPFSFDYKLSDGNSMISKNGRAHLVIPCFISGRNQIALSPQYKFLELNDFSHFNESCFYQFSVRLAWRHKLSNSWDAALFISPSLASAYGNFSSEAWMWSGGIRITNRTGQSLLYYFGIAYSNRFLNNLLVPVAGFKWNPVPHINLSFDLPSRARLLWEISERIHTGLQFAGNREISYLPNQQEYDYFWLTERNLSLFSDFKLFRNWWISADLGYSLKRNLLAYRKPAHALWRLGTQFDHIFLDPAFEHSEKGGFLNISLSYRLGKRGGKTE